MRSTGASPARVKRERSAVPASPPKRRRASAALPTTAKPSPRVAINLVRPLRVDETLASSKSPFFDTVCDAVAWRSLGATPTNLRLAATLHSGQSFRWYRCSPPTAGDPHGVAVIADGAEVLSRFAGVVNGVAVELRETDTDVEVRMLPPPRGSAAPALTRGDVAHALRCVRDYLQLDSGGVDRADFDAQWLALDDPGFTATRAERLRGVRVLRIPLLETIVTFVGSANNNIKRNAQMVEALCARFATNIVAEAPIDAISTYPGASLKAFPRPRFLYRFPTVSQMATLTQADFLEMGWGYRSGRMVKLLCQVVELGRAEKEAGGDGAAAAAATAAAVATATIDSCGADAAAERWLDAVRALPYVDARDKLTALCGVGRKVADCICLFALRHDGAIPVDTHCYQFATRWWCANLARHAGGLSKKKHDAIGDAMRRVFGPRAGWAFMTLFVGEVHPFRLRLREKPQQGGDAT